MDAEGVGIRCRRRIAAERRTVSNNDSPTPFHWFRLRRAVFNPWQIDQVIFARVLSAFVRDFKAVVP